MSEVYGKPSVVNGVVPRGQYVFRFIDAKFPHVSPTSGGKSFAADIELVKTMDEASPDRVTTPQGEMKVGGLKARAYFTMEQTSNGYAQTYGMLEKLQLLNPEGGIVPDAVVAAMKSGRVFFTAITEGEIDYHRAAKKPGETVGAIIKDAAGNDSIRGYRLKAPFSSDIIDRLPAGMFGLDEFVMPF